MVDRPVVVLIFSLGDSDCKPIVKLCWTTIFNAFEVSMTAHFVTNIRESRQAKLIIND